MGFEKGLVFLLLLHYAWDCLLVLAVLSHPWLAIWRRVVGQICKSLFGFSHVFCENVVDVAVLNLLLTFEFLVPSVFQDQLQLLLLVSWKLVSVLKQFHKLLLTQADLTTVLLLVLLLLFPLIVFDLDPVLISLIVSSVGCMLVPRVFERDLLFPWLSHVLALSLLLFG